MIVLRCGFSFNSVALAGLWLGLVTAACGGEQELGFVVEGGSSCSPFCQVDRIEIYLLKPLDKDQWCLLASRSFAPSGEQTVEGLDLEPHSSLRITMLGYCQDRCACYHDDTYLLDPDAGSISIELKSQSAIDCRPPQHEGWCL